MNALRDAAKKIDNYRLNGASLYVTLEPCLMCFGACIHSRIDRLIFATEDQKSGVVINNLKLQEESFFNHKISISSGILANESSELLKKFFQERRN
jgi:tRNA(adenine34) deaminase